MGSVKVSTERSRRAYSIPVLQWKEGITSTPFFQQLYDIADSLESLGKLRNWLEGVRIEFPNGDNILLSLSKIEVNGKVTFKGEVGGSTCLAVPVTAKELDLLSSGEKAHVEYPGVVFGYELEGNTALRRDIPYSVQLYAKGARVSNKQFALTEDYQGKVLLVGDFALEASKALNKLLFKGNSYINPAYGMNATLSKEWESYLGDLEFALEENYKKHLAGLVAVESTLRGGHLSEMEGRKGKHSGDIPDYFDISKGAIEPKYFEVGTSNLILDSQELTKFERRGVPRLLDFFSTVVVVPLDMKGRIPEMSSLVKKTLGVDVKFSTYYTPASKSVVYGSSEAYTPLADLGQQYGVYIVSKGILISMLAFLQKVSGSPISFKQARMASQKKVVSWWSVLCRRSKSKIHL